jgi:DtxR family Mn-dependent transcriptional regulator
MPNILIEEKNKNNLTVSLQDYLETIGLLVQKNKIARVKDIAKLLNVKLASVSEALKKLEKKGYIEYSPYKSIVLTKKGEEVANFLINAHNILKELFSKIFLMNEEESDKISCIVEHYISDDGLRKIERFLEFYGKYDFFETLYKNYINKINLEKIDCKECEFK